jgi:alpha-L-glutamate ligase-like protein
MPVSKVALGMNARNYLYVRPNNKSIAKKRADDKLLTKKRLIKHSIPTPALIEVFKNHRDARDYDWNKLKGSFVLKPARGFGGGGILVIRNWNGKQGRLLGGKSIDIEQLESEIFSIIDGAYSINHLPDTALIEKRVVVSSAMRKLSKKGVPDIRVIVYDNVPIMAMLRLPTQHSNGCANLHQGAIGIGIDIRTGITTKAVFYGKEETYIPGTKIKVRGIKIPKWYKILKYAVQAQKVSGLGYAGIDVVLDETDGPLVLEVNARPGLQIQLANGASLRTRLERVEGMQIPTVEYGIDLAKRLFAETALTDVPEKDNVLNIFEKITMYGSKRKKVVIAKIDTGAYSTSIDDSLVEELGLVVHPRQKPVRSGLGFEVRDRVDLLFRLHGRDIKTDVSHTDRSLMRFPVIIGRRDLKGFLIDPLRKREVKSKGKKVTKKVTKKTYEIQPHIQNIRQKQ